MRSAGSGSRAGLVVTMMVVAAVIVVVVSSCTAQTATTSPTTPPATTSAPPNTTATNPAPSTPAARPHREGPLIWVDTHGEHLAALVVGPLGLVGGCLAVGEGPEAQVIVWSADVSWDAAADAVVLADGTRIPVGAQVALGGGGVDPGTLGYYPGGDQAAAEVAGCGLPPGTPVHLVGEGDAREVATSETSST